MLLIACPWCGPREQVEFRCAGEAHVVRPGDAGALSDEAFADYLFMRRNPRGPHAERWVHAHGCRRWFHMLRDTRTNAILAIYQVGEPRPEIPDPGPGGEAGR